MLRRDFIKALSAATAFAATGSLPLNSIAQSAQAQETKPPNIVFIMADDLGYGDIACFGNPIVKTPNIDKLALTGQCLTQHYSAGPVCMPSRVALLTGKYPYRSGSRMTKESRPPSLKVTSFPKLLSDAGYTNKAVGKWHAGNFPSGLKTIGFDDYAICAPGGWCDFWEYNIHKPSGKKPSKGYYSTDMITDESVKFIQENRDKPFFLYTAYTAPHFPLQARPEDLEEFKDIEGIAEGTAIVYAMIKRMDQGIGQIVQKLKDENLFDNTLIVFTSDNGPNFGSYKGLDQKRYNANLAESKSHVAEGGIKVPTIVHWPRSLKPVSQTYPHMMHLVDWFPTLLSIAGVQTQGKYDIDGTCYLSQLLENKENTGIKRYWSYNKTRPSNKSNCAMRQGPWKLYRPSIKEFNSWNTPADFPLPDRIPEYRLYRIDTDPCEKNDLSARFPERRNQMIKDFEGWYDKVIEEHNSYNK